MPISTVTTVTEHGITLGLSDTLDVLFSRGDLTAENIAQFAICGWSDLMVKRGKSQLVNPRTDMPAAITVPQSPWQTSLDAGNAFIPYYNNDVSLDDIKFYGINFLLYGANNASIITDSDYTDYRIVTNISDYQKLYANGGSKTTGSDYNGTIITCTHTADGTPRTYKCMNPCGDHKLFSSVDDGEINIQPFACIPYNDTFFIMKGFYFPGISSSGVQTPGWSNYTGLQNYYLALKNSHDYTQQSYKLNGGYNIRDLSQTVWLKTWGNSTVATFLETDDANEYNAYYELDEYTVMLMHRGAIAWGTCDVTYNIAPKDWNAVLNEMAFCGVKFKVDNTIYRPIISGGVVTGYTSDPSVTSEFDNISNVIGNNVPVSPPSPSGNAMDKEIEMPLAYIGGTAGMVSFIKINSEGLASADDISDAISRFDIATIGKDLLRNFVSFKCFAVINIDDSVVRDIKVAGHTLKNSSDNALQGEYIGGVAPIDFDAGTVRPLYNDYRDYAPYTRIQMYVPFCGWFDLPSWCMGKKITGTMFTDLYNGTVKAVIYASSTVVAEVGGCCAFDIPFAAESTGMKAGAVISSALNTVAMTGATIAAPNIATGIAAASSAANFISAANSNGTTLKGVMGDGSNLNGLLHVYLKITRPKSPIAPATNIPDQYKHEYGIPCFKQLKLAAGDGYTQVMDAKIEGTMTDREKQMIIDGFRHGLIL